LCLLAAIAAHDFAFRPAFDPVTRRIKVQGISGFSLLNRQNRNGIENRAPDALGIGQDID